MTNAKEFKTIDEQISLLKSRNLKFNDENIARLRLKKYNYFDIINGTENILLKSTIPKSYDDVYFEDFFEIYNFYTKLRVLTLRKIFDVEARLKTSISYNFASLFCRNLANTLNYTERQYYQTPDESDSYLHSTFMTFDLFKRNTRMPNGTTRLGFVERKRNEKDYIKKYNKPPFWVMIKDFSFGELYFTYCFQKDVVKEKILDDFNLSLSDDKLFQQILHTMKYARNCCAHLELITRFKLLGIAELNNYRELKVFIDCHHKHLSYYDLLKILAKFCDVSEISKAITDFHRGMYLNNRTAIANKLLKRMGEQDIDRWQIITRK